MPTAGDRRQARPARVAQGRDPTTPLDARTPNELKAVPTHARSAGRQQIHASRHYHILGPPPQHPSAPTTHTRGRQHRSSKTAAPPLGLAARGGRPEEGRAVPQLQRAKRGTAARCRPAPFKSLPSRQQVGPARPRASPPWPRSGQHGRARAATATKTPAARSGRGADRKSVV